jgi:hypothetical protein
VTDSVRSTLVVPASGTATTQALSDEARRRGIRVEPVGLSSNLQGPEVDERVHFFGGPLLAEHVQRAVPLALMEPANDWLPGLPERFLRRSVRLMPALEAYGLEGRWFMKMPREKGLDPGPYRGFELPTMPVDEPLLVSGLVTMGSEWRFWVLDGAVHASSSYRRNGYPHAQPLDATNSGPLMDFMEDLIADQADRLPSAVVVDVAWIEDPDPGWGVIEANMAWFSSHYAGDPSNVLDVVMRSAGPPDLLADRDRAFCT